jgi:CMP-N,N'-diacetyllegionaminic acid synthase
MLHALSALEAEGDAYDLIVLLEPTSPLTEASDVDAALEQLLAGDADAIVGVSAMETQHPAFSVLRDAAGRIAPAQSADFAHLPRRQDLAPVYALDGSLYISSVDALRRESGFCHAHTLGYVTERHKAFEVDDLVDFIAIEAILQRLPEIRADAQRKPN